MELRPTTDGDLPALHATFVDAIATVFAPRGFDVPAPSLEVFSILQRHVLATGVGYVAEDDGGVVGFARPGRAATTGSSPACSCAAARRAAASGRQLLDAVWGDARRRRTVTDAIQPVSNVLYGRRGLVPATPLLTFTGVPQVDASEDEAPGRRRGDRRGRVRLRPDGRPSLLGAPRAAQRVGRRVLVRLPRRRRRAGRRRDARRGGACARRGARPAATGPVRVRIPGSARELVEVALRAGLRLGPVPGLVLLSRGVEPPTALAPSGYMLF